MTSERIRIFIHGAGGARNPRTGRRLARYFRRARLEHIEVHGKVQVSLKPQASYRELLASELARAISLENASAADAERLEALLNETIERDEFFTATTSFLARGTKAAG